MMMANPACQATASSIRRMGRAEGRRSIILLPYCSANQHAAIGGCHQRRGGSRGGKADGLRTNAVRCEILARSKFVCKFCVAQIELPNHG